MTHREILELQKKIETDPFYEIMAHIGIDMSTKSDFSPTDISSSESVTAWENAANPLVINAETIQSRLHDCAQAYDEAAQLRSEAKTMTELVFILDRLLAILGRILGR